MKKLVCVLLAVLMSLSLLAGCAAGETAPEDYAEAAENLVPTMFYDITGIPHDQTVVTVGNTEVPAELYFYWVCYVCSSLEYNILSEYSNYGMYSTCIDKETMSVNWESSYAGVPLMDYALAQVEDTMKYYMSIEELAKDLGVGLTTANLVDMENTFHQAVEEMGGGDAFLNYLKMLGISRENFDRLSASSYLYMDMLDLAFQEDSELYLEPEEYNSYATYADHILIATQDMKTGEAMTPQESVEKYQLAETLLEQIRASGDPVATFEQLADEYSDDPGREENPTGYIYTPGSMVTEFETTAASLEPGEISDVVQSDYGFHIILRRDLLAALEEDESRKVEIAKEYLDGMLIRKRSGSEVTYDVCLDGVDWVGFYKEYITEVDRIAAEMEVSD